MNEVLIFFINAGFSISSIFICFCILTSYFFKNNKDNLEKKSIFFILCLFSIIMMCLAECLYVWYFIRNGLESPYAVTLYQIYSITILFSTFFCWLFVINYYASVHGNDEKANRRKNIFTGIILSIELVIAVMIFLLPVNIYSLYGVYTFKSLPITVILVYVLISTLSFVFLLYYNNDTITSGDLYPSVVSLIIICLFLVFRLVTGIDLNVESFQITIFLLGVFFTVENQDYELVKIARQKQVAAQNATNSQREFLANVSHEIRTPMNTILGLSQLLLEEKQVNRDTLYSDMKDINTASVSLLSLIKNITDFSSVSSEKEQLVETEYDIQELLFNLNNDVLNIINNENVHFDFVINENVPKKLLGDSTKISRSLLNIINYVISNTNNGQIFLDVKGENKEDSYEFIYTISCGGSNLKQSSFDMDSDDFSLFDSTDRINSQLLGLLVSKYLVRNLKGKLEFFNEEGQDARYVSTLNQKVVDSTPVGNIIYKAMGETEKELDLTGKRFLVIDNNEVNTKLIKRLLEKYNPFVDICFSSSDGLDKFRETKYDLIFLDDVMPDFDASEVLAQMKNLMPVIPPVIALVENVDNESLNKYLNNGFSDCLSHPINYTELNSLLNRVFDNTEVDNVETEISSDEGGVSND